MPKDKALKTMFQEKVICPACKQRIIIKKTRKLLHAATPADYEEKVFVEKDSQTTLTK